MLGSCAAFQSIMSGSVMTSTPAHASVQARRVGVQLNGPQCYRAARSYSAAQRVFSQMSRTSNSACKRRRVASLAASVGAPSGPSLGRVIVNDARTTFGVSGAYTKRGTREPKITRPTTRRTDSSYPTAASDRGSNRLSNGRSGDLFSVASPSCSPVAPVFTTYGNARGTHAL